MSKKPEKNYAAELWKDRKQSLKPKRKRLHGNRSDEKKSGALLKDAKKKSK